jgi:predicted RNase H-like HicB family nuclease
MHNPAAELQAVAQTAALEEALVHIEQALAGLHAALVGRDSVVIEREADKLHQALARAVGLFAQAARRGGLPPELRHRLAHASAQVARQREALARATAALDRALDVLLPGSHNPATPSLYGPAGGPSGRNGLGGLLA